MVLWLVPIDFHLFGCLKKHLVGKRFATDARVKLSSPDYRHLTPVSSMLGYKHWCHGGTDAYMSMLTILGSDMCPACIKVSIKFYATEHFFTYLLKLFFIIMEHDSCFRGRKEGIKKAANKDNLSYMKKISVHFMFTKSQL
jgi:hypothetical protein